MWVRILPRLINTIILISLGLSKYVTHSIAFNVPWIGRVKGETLFFYVRSCYSLFTLKLSPNFLFILTICHPKLKKYNLNQIFLIRGRLWMTSRNCGKTLIPFLVTRFNTPTVVTKSLTPPPSLWLWCHLWTTPYIILCNIPLAKCN